MQRDVDTVRIEDSLLNYLLTIIEETRRNEKIRLGASPRGGQFLLKAAKAMAYYEGRDYIVPGDMKNPLPWCRPQAHPEDKDIYFRCRKGGRGNSQENTRAFVNPSVA